ncbi:MAG: DNA cytosine methyltransferase [Candidatus Kariarchaeaceae archaeon]
MSSSNEIVDLFCGGGGSSEGLHQAGFQTKFAIDMNEHAVLTFNSNHGNVAIEGDVSTLRSERIMKKLDGKPVLVTASPPCEPFTAANSKRISSPFSRLFDDTEGRLMLHALRLISDLDPEFWMIENVRGIIEGGNKKLLKEEATDLGLGKPYFNWIEAHKFGVPSYRTRIIISNFEIKTPKKRKVSVRDAIGDLPNPRYPSDYPYHEYLPVTEKYQDAMLTQEPGHGLVFFFGSNKDYQNYIRLHYDKPAPVVMGKSKFVHPEQDRILTPFEHARLMTFPEDYIYRGNRERIYDMIGEAVPPLLTREIGNQIMELM